MQVTALEGGFSDPAIDAARAFRGIMEAMARPGRIETVQGALPPPPLSVAAGVALLTLCDHDTPVHLAGQIDTPEMRAWLSFHTGAPFCAAEEAAFAVGNWAELMPITRFQIGTPEYPDRSATLIVEVDRLAAEGAVLKGPGVKDSAALSLPDRAVFQANRTLFPLGLDFVFTCGDRLAALPRTTQVT